MVAQTGLEQGSDIVEIVDIMDHFVDNIHYYVNVLSVLLVQCI